MEEKGFITVTAAHRQGAMEILRLPLWGDLMSSIFIYNVF